MKHLTIALVAIFAQFASAQDTNDGSLVPSKMRNPYLDRTAKRAGDVLTVVVDESSTAALSANTTAAKKDSNAIDKLVTPFLKNIPLVKDFLGGLSTGANSSNSGSGATNGTTRLNAKISVVVKEVLPNGNLVIEGNRIVKVNKDLQIYKLTGIVRPDDVRRDNTVKSEAIAEANITTDGKGLIGDRQRRGILTRLLDWLF